jgi:hypothetical protein
MRRVKYLMFCSGRITLLLCSALQLATNPAFSNAFDYRSPGQLEQYGVGDPLRTTFDSSSMQTTHHRLGNDGGIGSSTLQTTSATSESTPRVDYSSVTQTTSADVGFSARSFSGFRPFSQRMLATPLLSPIYSQLPDLSRMMSPGLLIPGTESMDVSNLSMPSLRSEGQLFTSPARRHGRHSLYGVDSIFFRP